MHTKRIHHRTEKRHTFATLLQVPLMGMERQLQLLAQVLFYRGSGFNKFALGRRDECGQILQLRDDGILALLTYRPYTATIRKIDKLT